MATCVAAGAPPVFSLLKKKFFRVNRQLPQLIAAIDRAVAEQSPVRKTA